MPSINTAEFFGISSATGDSFSKALLNIALLVLQSVPSSEANEKKPLSCQDHGFVKL